MELDYNNDVALGEEQYITINCRHEPCLLEELDSKSTKL